MTAILTISDVPALAEGERHYLIRSPFPELRLFLRHLAPARPGGRAVLYVHGGTFPSALSIAHRFDGQSWRDSLCRAGFDVWSLDFHGFGALSDPWPEMAEPAGRHPPLGGVDMASRQLEAAIRFIIHHHGVPRVSLIAHSWGTMVAGDCAGRCPDLVDRLVLFGPIAQRAPSAAPIQLPAWRLITLADQWARFTAEVPPNEMPVLSRRHFDAWGEAYLDADPASRNRMPAAVKVPSGAFQDIYDAWDGRLAYDPRLVRAPVAIMRGEWDSMCTNQDAEWLCGAFSHAAGCTDIRIPRATHLAHLEENRHLLYRAAEECLGAG